MMQISARALVAIRAGINRLGASLMRLSRILAVSVVAAIGASIKAAADFQQQMQMINTMLDDRTEPLLEGFAQDLEDLSKAFGQSTKTLSRGLFDILSAQIPAAKAMDVLGIASKTAVAGITDVATTTRLLVGILNAYGMEVSDVLSVSDKLFGAYKKGVFTFDEMAQTLGTVTATASTAGLSFDELLGTIATVTRGNIKMNEAVTSLNALMTAFIKPTDEAQKVAKKFGLELSSETLKTIGLVGAVQKLKEATAEQLAQIVPRIRGFKALARALSDVAALEEDVAFISTQSAGLMTENFIKMAATAGFQTRRLGQQVIATGRSLGDPLLSPFGRAIVGLNEKFGRLEEILEKNRKKIRAFGDGLVDAFKPASDLFDTFLADLEAEGFSVAIKNALNTITKAIGTWINENSDSLLNLGVQMGEILIKGFNQAMKNMFGQFHKRQMSEIKELGEFLRTLASTPAVTLENARVRQAREFETRIGERPPRVGDPPTGGR
jgi:TP901 family phage tail tape measure protein